MRFDAVTLFPEMFGLVRDQGVTGRAHTQGIWSLKAWNPRDFTHDAHRTVDDRPYGGGPGMVMLAAPLEAAVDAAQAERAAQGLGEAPVVLLAPTGRRYGQREAQELASAGQGAIFICGRYEGVDQRFIDAHVDMEISLGDFVLSGAEIPALALLDAVARLQPGVLNDQQSHEQDSFSDGLLDHPHYSRPEIWSSAWSEAGGSGGEGSCAPRSAGVHPVLLSGNHAEIARWRRERQLELTARRRPDLIQAARAQGRLDAADEAFLAKLPAPPRTSRL